MDGAAAYWSIPLEEDDIPKTAFITAAGQFEFLVMPFGLCNAPATYQRTIDKALRNVPYSLPNLDDTLTHSSSFSEHLNHLRATMECYRKAGLQLRRDKCKFAYRELEFVGHVVSANGHRPTPTLVERIRVQKQPNSVRELKAFLGFTNYYWEYIRNYALIASLLYRLMAGRAVWS